MTHLAHVAAESAPFPVCGKSSLSIVQIWLWAEAGGGSRTCQAITCLACTPFQIGPASANGPPAGSVPETPVGSAVVWQ